MDVSMHAAGMVSDREEDFEAFFERHPAPLYRTDPQGSVLAVNEAMVRMLGYPDRHTLLIENAASVYVDERDRQRWRALFDEGNGDVVVFHMLDRRYDGRIIEVKDVARAVRDARGRVLWFEGMLEDVSGRRRSSSGAGGARSFEVVWRWDLPTGRVEWSDSLGTVLGHDPARPGPGVEQSYSWWLRHIHPDDRLRVAGAVHHAIPSDADTWKARYRFRRADGAYVEVLEEVSIRRDEEGRAVRLTGIIHDLSATAIPHMPAVPPLDLVRPPLPPTPDYRLVEWCAEGDDRAFDELWQRHHARLERQIDLALPDRADAEEVVVDTFVQAWSTAASYDPGRGSVSAWLTTIARGKVRDRLRRRGRRDHLLQSAPLTPMTRPAATCERSEAILLRQVLESALARLPEPQRHAIELAFRREFTHQQIAKLHDVPLGTVKSRIRSGLQKLRAALSDVEEGTLGDSGSPNGADD